MDTTDESSSNNLSVRGINHAEVYDLVYTFFGKDTVSVGAYARRALFLLIQLAAITNTVWRSYTLYRADTGYCTTILYTSYAQGKYTRVTLKHLYVADNRLTGVCHVINTVINSSKWLTAVASSTVDLKTSIGDFEITRSKYNFTPGKYDKSALLLSWVVRNHTSGLKKLWFKCVKPNAERIQVNSYSVVSEDHNPKRDVPVDILDAFE